jgi:uncharacterized surface protein with fasciclin (FAS1) repeats
MNKRIAFIMITLVSVITLTYNVGCKKVEYITTTTTDVNIYSYLQRSPDKFSEFVKILEKAGYADFLNAYGAYTLFAPTNDGVKAYLQEKGKASVEVLSVQEAQDISKLHLIQDTINTNSFKDGKLSRITMFGQYLLAGVTNVNGVSSYSVNRQAVITQTNVSTGNGLIHVIDHVLKPATKTLAQLIEENPNYSIFTQALKETGYYDLLNIVNNPDTTRRFLTVLAETNKALQDSGFSSYAALKAKYSKTSSPKNPNDSLHLYVAYHITLEAKFLADIVSASSHTTLAPLEVFTSKLSEETVLINDLDFNGIHEQGIVLDRAASDIAATNGVLHSAKSHFAIKVRLPAPVYWDVADFPEVRKLPSVFRKANFAFATGSIKDIVWETTSTVQSVTYTYSGPNSSNFFMYYGDYLTLPIGLTNAARSKWFEFRTPILVKGRYKVWICYRAQKSSNNNPAFPLRTLFDGNPFSRLFDFQENVPAGTTGELEALGWKLYSESNNNYMAGRLLGTVDVKTTDRHTIRIEALTGGGQTTNNLDMIHFIPVDMNQVSPRFKKDGTTIP